jgi:hypothetical protein
VSLFEGVNKAACERLRPQQKFRVTQILRHFRPSFNTPWDAALTALACVKLMAAPLCKNRANT